MLNKIKLHNVNDIKINEFEFREEMIIGRNLEFGKIM